MVRRKVALVLLVSSLGACCLVKRIEDASNAMQGATQASTAAIDVHRHSIDQNKRAVIASTAAISNNSQQVRSATRATEASAEGLRVSTVAVRANTEAVERSTDRQLLTGDAMQRNLAALRESTVAIRANTTRLLGAISSSIAMLGGVALNALAVSASTSALVESRREVHANTEVLETLGSSLDGTQKQVGGLSGILAESRDAIFWNTAVLIKLASSLGETQNKVGILNGTLAESGALAAVATLLFGLLYFLSQWSWARLGEHRSGLNSKRGDPEMVLFSYLLASTFVCLVGVGVFSFRWLNMDAQNRSWSVEWGLAPVVVLMLTTIARFAHSFALVFMPRSTSWLMRGSRWLTTTRGRGTLSAGRDRYRIFSVGLFCLAVFLVLVLMGLDTWSQKFEQTANGLLIVLFSMFSAGVYDAVICDDLKRISEPYGS